MISTIVLLALVATTITDVGWVVLMALIGWAVLTVARTANDMRATLPGIKLEVGQINRAVNHVSPDESPLIEQVRQLHRKVDSITEWFGVRLDDLERRSAREMTTSVD